MDQVHVVRHKVLVEGRTQRAVARELGLARTTVRKYLGPGGAGAEGGGRAAAAAGLGRGGRAGAGAAGRVGAVDGRQAAADRHAAARVAAGRRAPRRRDRRQRRGRGVEAAAPRGLRAADVSAGRSRRGRLLRGAGRRRRDAPQGVALPDAADVLGPRLRVDLRAPGSNQLSRRARPRLCAFRRRAGARRVRQSAGGGRADPGRRRAHADAAVRGARLALPARSVFLSARRRPRQGRRRGARQSRAAAGARADSESARRSRRSTRRCWRRWMRGSTRTRDAAGQTIGARFTEEQRQCRAVADCRSRRRRRRSPRCRRARWCGSRARSTRCGRRWAGLDLVVRIGATTVTIVGRDGLA